MFNYSISLFAKKGSIIVPLDTSIVIKVASNSVLIKVVDKLLEILVNARWISSVYADRAQTMQKVCRYDQKQKNLVVVHKFDH